MSRDLAQRGHEVSVECLNAPDYESKPEDCTVKQYEEYDLNSKTTDAIIKGTASHLLQGGKCYDQSKQCFYGDEKYSLAFGIEHVYVLK